jgi:hypothetical protein
MITAGSYARVSGYSEILFVVAVDSGQAWLKDDYGNRVTHQVEDLDTVPDAEGRAYFERCASVDRDTDDFVARDAVEHRKVA